MTSTTTTTSTRRSDTRPTAPQASAWSGVRQRFSGVTLTAVITWLAAICFVLILLSILVSVLVTSFATVWRGTWWPEGLTAHWYADALSTPGLLRSILTTFEVGFAVVALALIAGVPTGYVLARKNFPGKSIVMLLMLLPVILPTMTYAVQLAAMMYRIGLGGSLLAVILVNLVPALPLVILITIPFVEQISPDVEHAAKVFGANNLQLFGRVLVPLLIPGIVAAGILCLVRVLGQFELTFFVANAKNQTLVVTIFGKLSDPGGVSASLTAAMSVFYMVIALIGLVISLRFANPAQALTRTGR